MLHKQEGEGGNRWPGGSQGGLPGGVFTESSLRSLRGTEVCGTHRIWVDPEEMGGVQGASGRGSSSSQQQAVGGVEMCGPESQAQKLSRQGMTHTHLLNLTLPWCLPLFLATGFFFSLLSSSPGLSKKGREPVTYRPPTPGLHCPGPGHLGALGIPAGGREPSQLSRARKGARKGSSGGRRITSDFKTRLRIWKGNQGIKTTA